MSKFNIRGIRPATSSPVSTEAVPSGTTFEGGPGYARSDAMSELFLLAVGNFVSEDTFYESARERDNRFVKLVRQLAVEDPTWTFRLLRWLRSGANMRSASIVGAAEFVRASLDASNAPFAAYEIPGLNDDRALNRAVVDVVLQRADEPGELLAYWTSKYGRNVPKPIKRGIADAIGRLFTERSLIKYDTGDGYRFADVLELTHPAPTNAQQGDLFAYAIDRRHSRDADIPKSLTMLRKRADLLPRSVELSRALFDGDPDVAVATLREAGMTWEAVAGWLQGPMTAKVWETLIPTMGLMAQVRNLRNFDQAGVSDAAAQLVMQRLADPGQVAASRMLPFRFLSAYRAAPSLRWSYPLEQALTHSLASVPALPGRTLVLVDRSPSMWNQRFSERSTMPWADAAAVFGAAVALRAESADLVEFGIPNGPVPFRTGESVLKVVERFRKLPGTDIPSAVHDHLRGHDRVVIVTDEQTRPGWLPGNGRGYGGRNSMRIDDLVPKETPLYMWNFGGYQHGAAPSGGTNRHTFGGLNDQAFAAIARLEAGRNAAWPF